MISILVPIYNCNVYPLVLELHKQCSDCGINFEILCQDDASQSNLNIFNKNVNALSDCSFVSLKENIAHRENRNSLAEQAKYQYLLFIDGDSIIIDNNYIKKYIDNLPDFDVIYGGRLHPEKCPSENQKLRWKYGRFIEDKTSENRRKKPYKSLLFNNTVIKKDCFNKVKFDKNIKKYGHDDTQLSYQLNLLQVKINHIENPVEHGDIDTNLDYLNKTKESLENLISLYQEEKIDVEFVRLIQLYYFLKKTKSVFIISKLYAVFEKSLLKNLTGNNPNLLAFNMFRVGYLCTIN
ncbi:glycosyltransferase family 2 protein [Flavobacterium gawalongense]|uniref:Glycosyltransferase family 2 protein n=1 Tax=Flavobacterium gawalongense TaxID=2594432 RepID=A0A553BQU5_9FLAO|nr:glycosyltransferase family 2 protein [Flavobacterium gawalongense]TRX10632.1 glycosyltransferase family 2 protein [Flavobacterium gawalongense]TRX11781.1 glycosyltransferase family 2 protein [Flavobacterium gawalongense]TRX29573.1 glycosyltransferase family 2 protein [Flavobacterium gawalongense]